MIGLEQEIFPLGSLKLIETWAHILSIISLSSSIYKKKKLRGFGPLANYADRATAACLRSSANFSG
jgi:hypothetical protein